MPALPERWTLERKIPAWGIVVLALTCMGSGAGAAMAMGRLAERVNTLEAAAARAGQDHDLLLSVQGDLKSVQAAVERIERRQIESQGQ